MVFRSSFVRRRTILLILCPLILIGWWFLLFRSLQKTTVVQLPKAFANSTEDAIFELAAYDASTLGAMQFDDAEEGRNETGYSEYIVPDIVHYIQLENPYLEFVTLLSMLSTVRHHRPRVILVHSDRRSLKGKYWEHLLRVVNESSQGSEALSAKTIIRLNHIRRPKYVFGRKLSSVYHASDIARMKVLRAYGGIYLDNDVYVVQSLHRFRRFEFAIGWPEGQFLGTQVLACHRNARFLRLWHQSYRSYRPTLWYFNAGELPTTSILTPRPQLVHREKTAFGVHYLLPMLYQKQLSSSDLDWQRQFYAVHLLARHRPHDATRQYLNEDNIRDLDCTFGEMARLAYYGTRQMLPVS